MAITLEGMFTVVRPLFANALSPIASTLSPISNSVKLVSPSNALCGIDVILSSPLIEFRFGQFAKALLPIVVILPSKVIEFSVALFAKPSVLTSTTFLLLYVAGTVIVAS